MSHHSRPTISDSFYLFYFVGAENANSKANDCKENILTIFPASACLDFILKIYMRYTFAIFNFSLKSTITKIIN